MAKKLRPLGVFEFFDRTEIAGARTTRFEDTP
jgi:hypothetical protein